MIETGYFSNLLYPYSRSKVHVVDDGKPLCGCAISKNSEFQWCAHYINPEYIECSRCKTIARDGMRVPGVYKA